MRLLLYWVKHEHFYCCKKRRALAFSVFVISVVILGWVTPICEVSFMSLHQVMQKGQLLGVFSVACIRTNDILIHVWCVIRKQSVQDMMVEIQLLAAIVRGLGNNYFFFPAVYCSLFSFIVVSFGVDEGQSLVAYPIISQ